MGTRLLTVNVYILPKVLALCSSLLCILPMKFCLLCMIKCVRVIACKAISVNYFDRRLQVLNSTCIISKYYNYNLCLGWPQLSPTLLVVLSDGSARPTTTTTRPTLSSTPTPLPLRTRYGLVVTVSRPRSRPVSRRGCFCWVLDAFCLLAFPQRCQDVISLKKSTHRWKIWLNSLFGGCVWARLLFFFLRLSRLPCDICCFIGYVYK